MAKREIALRRAAEARHRKALGQTLDRAARKAAEVSSMADVTVALILLQLVGPRQQMKAIETRCQALEQRILELEAQRAIEHVER